jgi:hypothetical protein
VAEDWESRLIADLARLRREPPFRVDVATRVLAEVRRLAPPPRSALSPRTLGLAAAAILVLGAALTALVLPGLPALLADLVQGVGEVASLGGSAVRLALAAVTLAARALGRTADFLSAFGGLGALLAPLAAAALAAALAGMAGITSYVVGRDLLHGRREAV